MHISLDGFVAGPNGELNWARVNEELFDYVGQRISKGDTALYGRKTYQMMESYWPTAGDQPNASKHDKEHAKWYRQVRKVVLSATQPETNDTNTVFISDNIAERIGEIKQKPGGEILLFGSPETTHTLIKLGLIDGYWLFVNPVILGKGIPLFVPGMAEVKLQLVNTRQFNNGVTELNYITDPAT